MKILKCFLLLVLSFLCRAQVNNNAVFQVMFSSATGSPGPSANARNIGQQYHLLTATTQNYNNCNSAGRLQLEASYDNTTFFRIGVPILLLNGVQGAGTVSTTIVSASGAYAYVRANYVNQFGASCVLTVNYTGSVTGTLTGSAPFTAVQDTFIYNVGSWSSGGTLTNVASCPVSQETLSIYSLTLTGPGGSNVVTLGYHGGNASLATNINVSATLPAFVWPQGSRPYLSSFGTAQTVAPHLDLTQSAATEVDYVISWRCE